MIRHLDNLSPEEINELFGEKNMPSFHEGLIEFANRFHHFDLNQTNGIERLKSLLTELNAYITNVKDDQLSIDQLYGQFIFMEAAHHPDQDSMIGERLAYDTAKLLKLHGAEFDTEAAIDHAYLVSRHYL